MASYNVMLVCCKLKKGVDDCGLVSNIAVAQANHFKTAITY
jgi:hypothetical protein